jgi:hypothetical protein
VSLPNLSLTRPFSLSGIVNLTGDAGSSKGFATLFGYSTTRRILWSDTSNKLLVQMGAANLNSTAILAAGTTHHVAYTNDGATETIYVDGVSSGSQANAAATWNGAFWVGGYAAPPGAYQAVGTLEKVLVNGACLDAATVASLASAALTPPPGTGVSVMYWNGSTYVQAADGKTTTRPASGVVIFESGPSRPVIAQAYDIWVPSP